MNKAEWRSRRRRLMEASSSSSATTSANETTFSDSQMMSMACVPNVGVRGQTSRNVGSGQNSPDSFRKFTTLGSFASDRDQDEEYNAGFNRRDRIKGPKVAQARFDGVARSLSTTANSPTKGMMNSRQNHNASPRSTTHNDYQLRDEFMDGISLRQQPYDEFLGKEEIGQHRATAKIDRRTAHYAPPVPPADEYSPGIRDRLRKAEHRLMALESETQFVALGPKRVHTTLAPNQNNKKNANFEKTIGPSTQTKSRAPIENRFEDSDEELPFDVAQKKQISLKPTTSSCAPSFEPLTTSTTTKGIAQEASSSVPFERRNPRGDERFASSPPQQMFGGIDGSNHVFIQGTNPANNNNVAVQELRRAKPPPELEKEPQKIQADLNSAQRDLSNGQPKSRLPLSHARNDRDGPESQKSLFPDEQLGALPVLEKSMSRSPTNPRPNREAHQAPFQQVYNTRESTRPSDQSSFLISSDQPTAPYANRGKNRHSSPQHTAPQSSEFISTTPRNYSGEPLPDQPSYIQRPDRIPNSGKHQRKQLNNFHEPRVHNQNPPALSTTDRAAIAAFQDFLRDKSPTTGALVSNPPANSQLRNRSPPLPYSSNSKAFDHSSGLGAEVPNTEPIPRSTPAHRQHGEYQDTHKNQSNGSWANQVSHENDKEVENKFSYNDNVAEACVENQRRFEGQEELEDDLWLEAGGEWKKSEAVGPEYHTFISQPRNDIVGKIPPENVLHERKNEKKSFQETARGVPLSDIGFSKETSNGGSINVGKGQVMPEDIQTQKRTRINRNKPPSILRPPSRGGRTKGTRIQEPESRDMNRLPLRDTLTSEGSDKEVQNGTSDDDSLFVFTDDEGGKKSEATKDQSRHESNEKIGIHKTESISPMRLASHHSEDKRKASGSRSSRESSSSGRTQVTKGGDSTQKRKTRRSMDDHISFVSDDETSLEHETLHTRAQQAWSVRNRNATFVSSSGEPLQRKLRAFDDVEEENGDDFFSDTSDDNGSPPRNRTRGNGNTKTVSFSDDEFSRPIAPQPILKKGATLRWAQTSISFSDEEDEDMGLPQLSSYMESEVGDVIKDLFFIGKSERHKNTGDKKRDRSMPLYIQHDDATLSIDESTIGDRESRQDEFKSSHVENKTESGDPIKSMWGYVEGSVTAMSDALGLSRLAAGETTETSPSSSENKLGSSTQLGRPIDEVTAITTSTSGSSWMNFAGDIFPRLDDTNTEEAGENGTLDETLDDTATTDNSNDETNTASSVQSGGDDDGLLELALAAARSKHQLHNIVFDATDLDVGNEIKFSVITIALPLGILFQENAAGCWVTRVFRSGNAAISMCGNGVEVGDQLAAINGKSAKHKKVDQVCAMISSAPNPKEIELTFVRYVGTIRHNKDVNNNDNPDADAEKARIQQKSSFEKIQGRPSVSSEEEAHTEKSTVLSAPERKPSQESDQFSTQPRARSVGPESAIIGRVQSDVVSSMSYREDMAEKEGNLLGKVPVKMDLIEGTSNKRALDVEDAEFGVNTLNIRRSRSEEKRKPIGSRRFGLFGRRKKNVVR